MAQSSRRLLAVTPKRLDYAALVAKGYAGSECEAHLDSGEYREGAGDLRAALGHYLAAIDLSPTNAVAYRRAGDVYVQLGHHREGLAMYVRAQTQGDRSAGLACSMGQAAAQIGDYKVALMHFDRGLKACPQEASAYFHRSRVYRSIGDLVAAIDDLQKAIELEPKFLAAHFDLARYYAAQEQGDQAMAALRMLQHSRRWLQKARQEADFRFLRQFPSFWALMSGKALS